MIHYFCSHAVHIAGKAMQLCGFKQEPKYSFNLRFFIFIIIKWVCVGQFFMSCVKHSATYTNFTLKIIWEMIRRVMEWRVDWFRKEALDDRSCRGRASCLVVGVSRTVSAEKLGLKFFFLIGQPILHCIR